MVYEQEDEMDRTTRKLHVAGTETYINAVTGELHEMQVMEVTERDSNFQKLWVGQILEAVDALSTKRLKIVLWLIQESARHRNLIPMTVRQMADELRVSKVTVNKTLVLLEAHDIIRRETGRVWVNPDVVYKGGTNGRLEILTRYRAVPREEEQGETPEEEAQRLAKEEVQLMKQLEALRARKGALECPEDEAAAE